MAQEVVEALGTIETPKVQRRELVGGTRALSDPLWQDTLLEAPRRYHVSRGRWARS